LPGELETAPDRGPFADTDDIIDADDIDRLTDAQKRKLHASFSSLGIPGREQRLQLASRLAGRELGSSSDLTRGEASTVIDALCAVEENRAELRAEADGTWSIVFGAVS
jgi:hypothetical protein